MSLTQLPAWQTLAAHAKKMQTVHMRDLFASNPHRFEEFSIRFEGCLTTQKTASQMRP